MAKKNKEREMSEISNIFVQKKQGEEAKKVRLQQQRLEQAKARREQQEKEREEELKKSKLRYGGRGTPSMDYLGEARSGVLKTILGG
jgi:hypothetical protein